MDCPEGQREHSCRWRGEETRLRGMEMCNTTRNWMHTVGTGYTPLAQVLGYLDVWTLCSMQAGCSMTRSVSY